MILDWIIQFLLKRGIRGSLLLSNLFRKQYIHVVNKHGVKMLLDPREYLEKLIISDGYYEEEVIDHLLKAVDQDNKPVMWDIGANVGLHGLTLKKLCPRVEVCSFEPFHYNFKKLVANESLNDDITINKFNFGLSNELSVNKIYTSAGNAGRTSFLNIEDTVDVAVNILSVSGDYLIENNIVPAPNIIKIDVEGMELPVFNGCKQLLQNPTLHTIIFEGPNQLGDNNQLVQLLESYGFEIKVIPRKIDLSETNDNYLAFRNNHTKSVHSSSEQKAKV